MKLYFFECGILRSQKQFFTAGLGVGEEFNVQVPFFLIEHPKGWVLYDTGCSIKAYKNNEGYYPADLLLAYVTEFEKEQTVVPQLAKLGLKPEDIKYVICSHLHFDHSGGLEFFPHATVFIQEKEIGYAYNPPSYMKAAYVRDDFDLKGNAWYTLRGWADNGFDLFGDGAIRMWYTPGHTPGHMSVEVVLPNSGSIVLPQDCCYTSENLNDGALPGLMDHAQEAIKSVEFLQLKQATGSLVVPSHDPETWKKFKKFPQYYD